MNKLYTAALLSVATLITTPVSAKSFNQLWGTVASGELSKLDRDAREGHIIHGVASQCHVFKNNKLVKKVPSCKVESVYITAAGVGEEFDVYFITSMQPLAIQSEETQGNFPHITTKMLKKLVKDGLLDMGYKSPEEVEAASKDKEYLDPETGMHVFYTLHLYMLQNQPATKQYRSIKNYKILNEEDYSSDRLTCAKDKNGLELCYNDYKQVRRSKKASVAFQKLYNNKTSAYRIYCKYANCNRDN